MARHLTPDERSNVVALLRSGRLTRQQIADRYGMSRANVNRIAAQSGIGPRKDPRPAPPATRQAATDRSWMDQAACLGEDPELFYPGSRGRGSRTRDADRARAVCERCPVRKRCDTYAAATGETWGIWAGRFLEQDSERVTA